MKEDKIISLNQTGIIGSFEIILSNEELAMLQLISTKCNDSLLYWKGVWKDVNNYEQLTFSSKELMPTAVKKIQDTITQNNWESATKGNAEFLSGLPRYTWTKNQYIINQYLIIASSLQKENIDFVALKGVCEMLANNNLSMMRTSRDIDILVKIEDWDKCLVVFKKIGWMLEPKLNNINFSVNNNLTTQHAITLSNKEKIIELDVHFYAIAGPSSYSKSFTSDLWGGKVRSVKYPNLFIPRIEHRLIIAAENAYNLGNWITGQYCKYLSDAMLISELMSPEEIEKTVIIADQHLKTGKKVSQLICILEKINSAEQLQSFSKRNLFRFAISNTFAGSALTLIYLNKLISTSSSLSQKMNAFFYILPRLMRKIFIRIPIRVVRIIYRKKNITNHPQYKEFYWYM